MYIPDDILRRALKNVYFLWGRGKTTIANRLREKYGFYVYGTDEARDRHWPFATPHDQPHMCRDYEKEWGVKSFWELPREVIAEREVHVLREVTPMILMDLVALSAQHAVVICEGDIDYQTVAPMAEHALYLRNCGHGFDWFNRPDHAGALDAITKRSDISQEEKTALIEKAYAAVAGHENVLPEWVFALRVPYIDWDDHTGIEQTLQEVICQFGFENT